MAERDLVREQHGTVAGAPRDAWPGWTHLYSGKVRDLFAAPDGRLLFVASDRISAYDYVLATTIPDKGRVLTQLSLWWFEQLADVVPNHVVSLDVPPEVAGRAMVCERLAMYPVECVARGYLTGSGLADYTRTGEVCGVPLLGIAVWTVVCLDVADRFGHGVPYTIGLVFLPFFFALWLGLGPDVYARPTVAAATESGAPPDSAAALDGPDESGQMIGAGE